MNCSLCKEEIQNYQKTFNHLKLSNSKEVDICELCIKTFMTWQQEQMARLFPTTRMKQWALHKKK